MFILCFIISFFCIIVCFVVSICFYYASMCISKHLLEALQFKEDRYETDSDRVCRAVAVRCGRRPGARRTPRGVVQYPGGPAAG